jgi:SAM-dependent methyltransferase
MALSRWHLTSRTASDRAWVRLSVRAGLLLCIAGLPFACRNTDQSAALHFPAPSRPVAPIVAPEYLDEAARDGEHEAERVLRRLRIVPGIRVADIGAGRGYYAVRLARRLGPGATIYAEDIQPAYLQELQARLERERIGTVHVILGTAGDPKLPPEAVDVAILAYVYHEIANPFELLFRLRPALAAGGRVGIIDTTRATEAHGTPPALLKCELGAVGYRQIDFFWLAPAQRYLAIFAPPDTLPRPESIKPCAP